MPCQIVADEHAFEMSLAENTVRLAMHPADQFEAFAELIGKGQTAAQVAVRFGVEEKPGAQADEARPRRPGAAPGIPRGEDHAGDA